MRVKVGETIKAEIPGPAGYPADLSARVEAPLTGEVAVNPVAATYEWVEKRDQHGDRYRSYMAKAELPAPSAGDWLLIFEGTGYYGPLPLYCAA